jgi:T5SS/PEP-CTERM-associated repeat protein
VDDPGSTLNVSGAIIDGYGGTGVISVWNGGQIDAGGEQAATGLALGGPSGSGILAITADGRVTIGGQADIGQFGAGLLEVTTGGTFSATASGNAALIAGVSSGATGSVLVSDPGSVMSLTGGLVVGSLGSGTFTAQNLSFVQVSNAASATALGVTVGAYAGGSGTLSLASQALLETSAGVAVGSVGAGVLNDTDALLYITAAPATGFSALGIGLSAGSSGTVNVAGGQIIDAGLAGTVIGSAGTGTLNITQGGVVQTGIATGNALVLGLSSGASGAVSISGSGSTLDVSGPVIDGNNGTGTITLAEGANFAAGSSASADALELGSTGGAGALSVSSLAEATVLGQLTVGEFGTGTVSISGGGQVSVDSSGIYSLIDGNAAGADGSVLITGAGSTLTLNDGAQIGITGAGSVSLQDGGVLDNTNTGVGVQVGEAGTVSLLGGTLLAGSTLTIEAGGTLTGQGSVSASAVIDSGSINATGGTLAFIGAISGSGSLSISGNADLSLSTTQGDGYTLANNLNFGAGGGTLTLGDVFGGEVTGGGTISGWASGDYVVLPNPTLENGYTPASESFANGTLTLFGSSGQVVDTLNFAGALTTNNFTLTQVGNDTVIGFHS